MVGSLGSGQLPDRLNPKPSFWVPGPGIRPELPDDAARSATPKLIGIEPEHGA